ncbi:unnamed protein product [Protopolystoma xenopodis]|uniref:Uncharacterized protein n=1 Tax=Protopolystoma xenopodis TaxID=117903 RepID=A0A448WS98_9PLAT|nr:unnamed protein product [Protopolystoma xenopodis]
MLGVGERDRPSIRRNRLSIQTIQCLGRINSLSLAGSQYQRTMEAENFLQSAWSEKAFRRRPVPSPLLSE